MLPVNYLAEFLGTFILVYIIFESTGHVAQPFIIAAGLFVAILMYGSVSGGHYNPAVTIAMWTKGTAVDPVGYIVAQIAGGVIAYKAHSMLTAAKKAA